MTDRPSWIPRTFTVGELIEKLKQYPAEMEVWALYGMPIRYVRETEDLEGKFLQLWPNEVKD